MIHINERPMPPTMIQRMVELLISRPGKPTWFDPEGSRRILPNVRRPESEDTRSVAVILKGNRW